ncbi:MAG TPA: sorbitol-6-phosphate dehydrogenase [Candidatus Hydrogenedentes bacterium]|nr:sorbitol-6-phosphate dehydrogenase [Candidatus Hydrogenedentota bacterium]
MARLQGKRAIVTGAAQGLGESIVERLATEGCSVAIWDINLEKAAATAARLSKSTGQKVIGAKVDVCDANAVRAAMDDTAAQLGGLDIFVSNAGILFSGDSIEFDIEKWRRVIDVNLTGYFICSREAARVMLQSGGGSIIQINSKSGKKGSFKNCAYAASKFGGIGVTQSLALEFAESGVRVNSICPGNLLDSPLWQDSLFKQYAANQGISEAEVRKKYVDQVPMKRPCTYRDVTNVVTFLASEDSSYMTGQAINVTGGQEMR